MKLASFVDLRTLSELLPVVLTLTQSFFAAKNTQKLSSVRFYPSKMQHGLRRWESQGTDNQMFVKFLHLVSVPIYLFRSTTPSSASASK